MIKKHVYFFLFITFTLMNNSCKAETLENLEWLKSENLTTPITLNINNKILDLDLNTNEIIEYYHAKLSDYYFLPLNQVSQKNKDCAINLKKNLYRLRSPDKLVELPDNLTWSEDPFNDRNWEYWFHSWNFTNCLLDGYTAFQDSWYLDRLKWLVTDWWQDNYKPNFPSLFSWNDLSTANRLHETLRIFEFLRRQNELDIAFTQVVLRAIYWHSRILAEEKPLYIKNHNHGMVQSRILFESSQIMSEFLLSSDWEKAGRERLKNENDFALTSNGVQKENSPSYHRWVTVFVANSNNFVEHYTGKPIVNNSKQLQEGGLRFLTVITKPDGTLPVLGDTIKGTSPRVRYPNQKELPSFSSYLYMITRGAEGIKPVQTTSIFKESGYFIYRDKWDDPKQNISTQLILKCGFLARGHRHNDDGNILLYGFGEDWLIDAGIYGYESNKYRSYVISPSAHNISFPYEAKDNSPWDYKKTNSLSTRFKSYANNWGLIEANDNSALCESHMFVGLTYKRALEITGDRSFRLTDSLIPERLENNSNKKFITAFKVPDDKTIFINTKNKALMVLNATGTAGLRINYYKDFQNIKVYRGEGGDITSLETTDWLKMAPAKTVSFISSGSSFAATFDLELIKSPVLKGFEKIQIGRKKTQVTAKEEKSYFSFFVKQDWGKVKVAFYLYKDGERVDTKWYSEDFLYTVSKETYGDGEYYIKYFLIDKNDENPSKAKKIETGYSKNITISQLKTTSQGGVFKGLDFFLLVVILFLRRRQSIHSS